MSAASTTTRRRRDRDRDRDHDLAKQTPTFKPTPFKPRRGLFAFLAVLNLLWIGALVWMYFATVRNASPPPSAIDAVQSELQRELDDLSATTRPGADGSPSAPR